jgi:ribosome-binding factor A
MKRRVQRLSEEIKREISEIIRSEIKDPRITSLVSITQVQVSSDLSHAKVFVSMLGDGEKRKETLEGLNKAKGYIKRELGKNLRQRITPDIVFHMDDSIQHGSHISQLLKKVMVDEEKRKEDDAD